jgi:hypothetical protein
MRLNRARCHLGQPRCESSWATALLIEGTSVRLGNVAVDRARRHPRAGGAETEEWLIEGVVISGPVALRLWSCESRALLSSGQRRC